MKRLIAWWKAPVPDIPIYVSRACQIPVAEAHESDLRRAAIWNRRQARKVPPTRSSRVYKRAWNEAVAEWLERWAPRLDGKRVCDMSRRKRRRFAQEATDLQQAGVVR